MRKPTTIVGALLAVLAVCATAVIAATAFAAEEEALWLCASEPVPNAKECLTLSENLETLTFEDRRLEASVSCPPETVLDEGWVGPGPEDETTEVTFKMTGTPKCEKSAQALNLAEAEVTNKCGTFESITAVNLPWKTLAELVKGVLYDTLSPGSSGLRPGYATKCTGVTDACLVPAAHLPLVLLINLTELEGSLLLVTLLFPGKKTELLEEEKEFAECSLAIPQAESGVVRGEVLLTAVRGGVAVSLEVSFP
jgi:hypothetical protein